MSIEAGNACDKLGQVRKRPFKGVCRWSPEPTQRPQTFSAQKKKEGLTNGFASLSMLLEYIILIAVFNHDIPEDLTCAWGCKCDRIGTGFNGS